MEVDIIFIDSKSYLISKLLMAIKLEQIPSVRKKRYPERISVALSSEAYKRLEVLKGVMEKDPSELMRMLLDDFLEANADKIKDVG